MFNEMYGLPAIRTSPHILAELRDIECGRVGAAPDKRGPTKRMRDVSRNLIIALFSDGNYRTIQQAASELKIHYGTARYAIRAIPDQIKIVGKIGKKQLFGWDMGKKT